MALTFALFSGKMMDETWLPQGELNHSWYYAHLIAWILMVVSIALHLLLNAKVGGLTLLLSMWSWKFRAKDSPALWSAYISAWWSNLRSISAVKRQRSVPALIVLEAIVLVSIAIAWIIPLFK